MKKKTILDFRRMAAEGEKIVYLTGYDYLTAKYEERAGIDMILVGDSLGNVILGYDSTYPVTMEDMLIHCKAVRRGAPNTFIVGDMPFMSYQVSDEEAVRNAGLMCKEARMDCVKLEGITDSCISRVKAINDAGMLVMGHIGLTPQLAPRWAGRPKVRAAKPLCAWWMPPRSWRRPVPARSWWRASPPLWARPSRSVPISPFWGSAPVLYPRPAADLRRHGGIL